MTIYLIYILFVQQSELVFSVHPGTPQGYTETSSQLLHTGVAVCLYCSKELDKIRAKQGRKYCGYQCYWKHLRHREVGPQNPCWRGGPVHLKCAECGTAFEIKRSLFKKQGGKFCSQKCTGKYLSRKRFGSNWKKTGKWIECPECRNKFYAQKHQIEMGLRKFCSRKCQTKSFWKRFSGEHHWWWKGGITKSKVLERSSDNYKQWRWAVFQRDNFTCQMCGQVGGKLSVHHIKKFSTHVKLRTFVPNGITLCWNCHLKVNQKESHYESILSSKISKLL